MATGRYAKGELKREEILNVALELIAERGYRKSTLREIGAAVDLSNAGVLHYFGSREQLLAEVLRLRDEAADTPEDVPFDLDYYVGLIEHNADVPGLVQLFVSLSADAVEPEHGAHDFFVERYEQARSGVAAGAALEAEAGRLPADVDTDRLATILLAISDGLQIQWLLDDSIDMADHLRYLLDLIRGPQ